MSYYLYENWQAGPHKAVLHSAGCGFCNSGRGRAGGYDPKHGKWHGPYHELADARAAQRAMPVKLRKECRCVS
jgi:hypothetical protein